MSDFRSLFSVEPGAPLGSPGSWPVAEAGTAAVADALKGAELPPRRTLPAALASALASDLPRLGCSVQEQEGVARSLADLAAGRSRAVVTGQQPGFAGGPLYTLFKIATTISLARLRQGRGLPTVPVFWLGDDDDDWAEAADPVFYDGAQDELVSCDLPVPGGNQRQDMIGTLDAFRLEAALLPRLTKWPAADDLGRDLQTIYREIQPATMDFSLLNEKVLRLVFRGTGLVILRGNDERLHRAAEPFYAAALPRLSELAQRTLAASRGPDSPIAENSLRRPLYVTEGQQRRPWEGTVPPSDPGRWRSGLLLRSLLQDWLLDPAAVVVGPGEFSYLSQLTAAYGTMGVARSPLVPRLFGWLLPREMGPETLNSFNRPRTLDTDLARQWALAAGQASEKEVVRLLRQEVGLDEERARELAAGRTRRWAKGVQAMLREQYRRQREETAPNRPQWVFPFGKRQERKLATVPCLISWGRALVETVYRAATEHLQNGERGQWHEYLLRVPDPPWWTPKERDHE